MSRELKMMPAALRALEVGDDENFVVATLPGGIEAQEARGQETFAAGDSLPIEMRGTTLDDLTSLGFVFGAAIDELFVECRVPEFWTKRPTEHPLHTEILDAAGKVRGSVFYKAAYYDRRADLRWFNDVEG